MRINKNTKGYKAAKIIAEDTDIIDMSKDFNAAQRKVEAILGDRIDKSYLVAIALAVQAMRDTEHKSEPTTLLERIKYAFNSKRVFR